MSQLHQLAYISRSVIQGTEEEIKHEVQTILSSSKKNNSAIEVTGALFYSGGYFCQVLEGPMKPLVELYARINKDNRHSGVTLLHFHKADKRLFSEWSMAFAGIERKLHFSINEIKESREILDDVALKEKGRELVTFLDELVRKHQSHRDLLPKI